MILDDLYYIIDKRPHLAPQGQSHIPQSDISRIPICRLLERLQEIRHTPMQIESFKLVAVVRRHTGDKGDDHFADGCFLGITISEGELADVFVELLH